MITEPRYDAALGRELTYAEMAARWLKAAEDAERSGKAYYIVNLCLRHAIEWEDEGKRKGV